MSDDNYKLTLSIAFKRWNSIFLTDSNLENLSTAASVASRTFCALINRHESNKIIKNAVAQFLVSNAFAEWKSIILCNYKKTSLHRHIGWFHSWDWTYKSCDEAKHLLCKGHWSSSVDVECQNELLNILAIAMKRCSSLDNCVLMPIIL